MAMKTLANLLFYLQVHLILARSSDDLASHQSCPLVDPLTFIFLLVKRISSKNVKAQVYGGKCQVSSSQSRQLKFKEPSQIEVIQVVKLKFKEPGQNKTSQIVVSKFNEPCQSAASLISLTSIADSGETSSMIVMLFVLKLLLHLDVDVLPPDVVHRVPEVYLADLHATTTCPNMEAMMFYLSLGSG